MPRVEWSQQQDLQRSIHRSQRTFETVERSKVISVWAIEAYTESGEGRKSMKMGTISVRGTWAGDGQVTCSIL